jgi:hypothetical protein
MQSGVAVCARRFIYSSELGLSWHIPQSLRRMAMRLKRHYQIAVDERCCNYFKVHKAARFGASEKVDLSEISEQLK